MSSTIDCSALDDGAVARLVAAPGHAAAGAAESELCRRFARRVRLYGLRHLRHQADADDLTQRVLLMTIEKLRRRDVREPDRIGSFVLGVARTLVHDHRRSRRPEVEVDDATAGLPPLSPPERDPLAETRLARCLEALAERERSVVVQTYFGEARSADIARSMAVAEGHVRVLRHRAIGRLRDCMGLDRPSPASAGEGAGA